MTPLPPLRILRAAALACAAWLAGLAAHAATPTASHIYFIGDSITCHEPAPGIGWNNSRGMAASADNLDYVHRLVARFAQVQPAPPAITIHAQGGGTVAGKLLDQARIAEQARAADLVIIQLGENDHDITGFRAPYENLIALVRAANPAARILCTAVWQPPGGAADKDAIIRSLCAKYRLVFADLGSANADPLNKALATGLWTDPGVNWHPSDAGMEAYAEAIWSALSQNTIPAPDPLSDPPAITSATSARAILGRAFSYQIEAAGSPTGYAAFGLPAGLSVNSVTGLVSGAPATAGEHGVTLAATNTIGTGSAPLALRVVPPFVGWAEDRAQAGADLTALADPDGDGLSNLLEYAFDLDPILADAASDALPAHSRVNEGSASFLALDFTIPPTRGELTYTVQTSPDLTTWLSGHAYGALASPPAAGVTAELENTLAPDGSRHIRVRDATALGDDAARRFLRLVVTPSFVDQTTVLLEDRFGRHLPGDFIEGSAPKIGAGAWMTVGSKSARVHDAGGSVGGDRDWYGGSVANTLAFSIPETPGITTITADVVFGDGGWTSIAFRGDNTGNHWLAADSRLWLIVDGNGDWTLFRDGMNQLASGRVSAFAVNKTALYTMGLGYDPMTSEASAFLSDGATTQTLYVGPYADAAAITAVGFCISTPDSAAASVDNFRVTLTTDAHPVL